MKFKLGQRYVNENDVAEALGDDDGANLKLLKTFYLDNKEFIRQKFFAGGLDGIGVGAELSALSEMLLRAVLKKAALPEKTAVIAVGGFGRQELAPSSDIDLWFLTDGAIPEEAVKKVLYLLWDLGIKIGHSVAGLEETTALALSDASIFTSLLDMRFLYGDAEMFNALRCSLAGLRDNDSALDFVRLKDAERKERHKQMGHARYLLEPNLKEGCGGLRDMHFVIWLAKYAFKCETFAELAESKVFSSEEWRKILKVKNFLFTVRAFLHFCAGRAEENLSSAYQKQIAPLMGYKPHPGTRSEERLMKRYYLTTRAIRELIAVITAKFDKRDADICFKEPLDILIFLRTVQEQNVDVSPNAYKQLALWAGKTALLAKSPKAAAILKDIICGENNPEYVLRILDESGILARIIPPFRAITARAQMDVYHIYTVDEHTLKTIGALHTLKQRAKTEKDFIASALAKVKERDVLVMGAFLHDIGKNGFLGHAENGALIAGKVCELFGFSPPKIEKIVWLVRNHLIMSKTAFQRDLSDVKTINDFALATGSEENVSMLLLLTVADIMAVAPNIWSQWKAELLKELYQNTVAIFGGINIVKNESIEPALWYMKGKAALADYAIDISFVPQIDANKVIVYAKDRLGLFAKIAGAMALARASIISARINTVDGFALDTFMVQEALNAFKPEQKRKAFTDKSALEKLEKTILAALEDKINLVAEMTLQAAKTKEPTEKGELEKRVIIDNEVSLKHTLIEINSLDRRGFLFFIAGKLAALNINIVSAHISTYGKRIVDAFYVTEADGTKITGQKRLEEVTKELYNSLDFNFKEAL